jgi:hypothetical protein
MQHQRILYIILLQKQIQVNISTHFCYLCEVTIINKYEKLVDFYFKIKKKWNFCELYLVTSGHISMIF